MKKKLLVLGIVLVASTGYGMGHTPVPLSITQPSGKEEKQPAKKKRSHKKRSAKRKQLPQQVWCRKPTEKMLAKVHNPKLFEQQYYELYRRSQPQEREQLWRSLNDLMAPDRRDLSITQYIYKESRLEIFVRMCLRDALRQKK